MRSGRGLDQALRALALVALAWQASAAQQPRVRDVTLRSGMVITRSTRIVRRVYDLRADSSLDSAVVIVRGNNITVDFNGAELRGSPLFQACKCELMSGSEVTRVLRPKRKKLPLAHRV